MTTSFASRAQLMLQLSRLLLLTLIASITAWTLWFPPTAIENPVTIWLFQTLPLACFLPGIFRGKPRTHIWLCFFVLVYFCSGVSQATSPYYGTIGLIQSLLTMALFSSAMMYVRWNGKSRKEEG
ncbi:DUF2069 domain-containing protein [Motiliproteus sp. MSK22-1]|uniref:DUF2069 domain-containing protein n=1 Tax=Motiliproteus sp. MSK22-1 TaxID=1897630 RepID=UPI0009772330|nr:DUF2069 domain-containing protein [Motiliproteus sp. MSK22-1]OMH25887.1 hypothetical protein BGP75_25585 [Motiliproteus sp. MSK22-1]